MNAVSYMVISKFSHDYFKFLWHGLIEWDAFFFPLLTQIVCFALACCVPFVKLTTLMIMIMVVKTIMLKSGSGSMKLVTVMAPD
jgi:hypothetical protein